MDSTSGDESQKDFRRKRHRKQTTEDSYVCSICGDLAASYNFGAICCESCKAFYRRSLTSQRSYTCASGDRCVINKQTRKLCPGCRMRKCCEAGMSSDPLTVAYIQEMRSGLRPRRKFTRKKLAPSDSQESESPSSSTTHSHSQRELTMMSSASDEVSPFPTQTLTSINKLEYEASVSRSDEHAKGGKQKKKQGMYRTAEPVPDQSSNGIVPHSTTTHVKPSEAAAATAATAMPQRNISHFIKKTQEPVDFNEEEYRRCVETCRHFAEVMTSPYSASELGPMIDNIEPDDPVSLARFPEAILRKYVTALKSVPEFHDQLNQAERFWLLKVNLVQQSGVVTAYLGDPYRRCFQGTTSTGAKFCHYAGYVIKQMAKVGTDIAVAVEAMMAFYGHIRENFPEASEWHVVVSFLCIVKFFSPLDLSSVGTVELQSSAAASDVQLSLLTHKMSQVYRKYSAMFRYYVQTLLDSRSGRSCMLASRIDETTERLCESLLFEAIDASDKETDFFRHFSDAIRSVRLSDSLIPLLTELLC